MLDNSFGISLDDVEDFVGDEATAVKHTAESLKVMLGGEKWVARAETIASLVGISPDLKLAMILFGPAETLFQMFLIHAVHDGEMTIQASLHLIMTVCESLVDPGTLSNLLGMYLTLGILDVDTEATETGLITSEDILNANVMKPGPLHSVCAIVSRPLFEMTMARMTQLRETDMLGPLGIVIPDDPGPEEATEEAADTAEEETTA